MDQRYVHSLEKIISSEHKNELIIDLLKDITMYRNREIFVKSVLKNEKMKQSDKLEVLCAFLDDD